MSPSLSTSLISNLDEYLPHDPPMVLVDRIVQFDPQSITVACQIKESYPFATELLGSWIGLEFMAQAAGVHAGLYLDKKSPKDNIGFLVGTRSYISHVPEFIAGSWVEVSLTKEFSSDNGISAVNGKIFDAEKNLLCEAIFTLYQADSLATAKANTD